MSCGCDPRCKYCSGFSDILEKQIVDKFFDYKIKNIELEVKRKNVTLIGNYKYRKMMIAKFKK